MHLNGRVSWFLSWINGHMDEWMDGWMDEGRKGQKDGVFNKL